MDFVTFVILNAVLYIRPMDFVPGVQGLPLYNISFCICFFFCIPALLEGGSLRSMASHPVSICVIGLALTAILSNLLQGQVQEALDAADMVLKILLYYILLLCVVRTPARMKWFLASLVIDGCIVAGLGVADYKGLLHVPNLIMVMEAEYVDGAQVAFRRLAGTGLFGDPNDLGLMIVGCVIYSAYLLGDRSVALPLRAMWLLPFPLLFQTLILTYSRGAALALMIGLGIYTLMRFGRRALPLALLALPLLLRGGGRQVDFNVSAGSGQARVAIWDAYLQMFSGSPLLGVGAGQWPNHAYQVAHNSYLHAFAERGFLGGMAFLSAILLAVWSLVRSTPPRDRTPDDELVRLRRFLTASVGSYAVGIMTLSRVDVIPTYTVLGLAVAFERMAAARAPSRGPLRLGPKLICLLLAASVGFLVMIFFFVKGNANYY